jgi:transcriptional regulator with GAF, ATPase, and Fis domain
LTGERIAIKSNAVRDFEALATLLVGGDPRLAADRTLGLLLTRCESIGGATLKLRNGELLPFVQRDVGLARFAEIQELWRQHRQRLTAGRVLRSPEYALVPLRDDTAIVGVLFLERPHAFDMAEIGASLLTLTKALTSRDAVPFTSYLTSVPGDELNRDHLLAMLDRNEWNIARVARVMGLARRTIYLRMQRYGIARKRVPKGAP